MEIYQLVRTKNDINGNPRKLWLHYDDLGRIQRVLDMDYQPKGLVLHTLDITPREYKELRRKK